MMYAVIIAGFIFGWIAIEIVAAFTKSRFPYLLNLGFGFVFTIVAYYVYVKFLI